MSGRLHGNFKRLALLLIILTLSLLPPALAQEPHVLEPGTSISGVLDEENVAQVFVFEANAGDVATLTAESSSGVGVAVMLTNSSGETLAQGFETSQPTTLADVELPAADTYYVTVLSALGVALPEGSTFDLTLELDEAEVTPAPTEVEPTPVPTIVEATPTATVMPTQAPETFEPGQILTVNGLQISLVWESLANLDLEVRDPVGGSVYFSLPAAPSGGQFGVNVNSVCDTRTADSPTEQAVWPAGALPTGSYELLVYYQPLDQCPTADPVTFDLAVQLDDESIDSIQGNLLPNETFVSSFRVSADGTLTAGESGLYNQPDELPVPFADLQAAAQPITRDVAVNGVITSGDYFDTYTFNGQANELITIDIAATEGSLDTLLLLLDSAGSILTFNDDIVSGEETDSSIRNFRLFTSGEYMIVATRYGKDVGGTEGRYTLSLTGPTGDIPQEVLDLGLPRGDLEIALTWNTAADLQLLVRDPRGDSVFDDTPQVPSGGRLAAGGNVNCVPAQTSPVSYVYWPEGTLTAGLYEVEVWYQNPCNDPNPVSFSLNILLDGVPIFTQTAQPTPNDVFVMSFVVGVDQQVQVSQGGFIGARQQGGEQRLDSSSLNIQAELASAPAIESGQTMSGSITNTNKFDVYTFQGEAGDVVTISLVATAGRLDTVLFLLDPSGFQVADNDDAVVGESTDSLISEFVLPEDGQYVIVATHFGMEYGGTTGAYDLAFSRLN